MEKMNRHELNCLKELKKQLLLMQREELEQRREEQALKRLEKKAK